MNNVMIFLNKSFYKFIKFMPLKTGYYRDIKNGIIIERKLGVYFIRLTPLQPQAAFV